MSYSLAFTQAIITVLFVADKVRLGFYDFVPTKELSEALNIPRPSLVKILQNLNRSGIIETREGAKGGVRLAKQATDITILDIFSAIEQERPLFRNDLNLRVSGEKPTRGQKAISNVLIGAEEAMKTNLQTTTVQDLIDDINA